MANLTISMDNDNSWFCPLLGRTIEDGYCADINYQQLGYFKRDILNDVIAETGKTVEAVSAACEACPNQTKVVNVG